MLKNPHSLCLLLPPLLLLPTTNSARSGQRAPWSPLLAGSHSPGTMRAGGISSIREEAKSHLLGPPQPARAAMGLWESRACCPSAGSQSASFFARDSSIQGDLMFDVQFQGAVVKAHRSEPFWTRIWEAELLVKGAGSAPFLQRSSSPSREVSSLGSVGTGSEARLQVGK